MNDTMKLPVRSEVTDFVDRVRARLSDLSDEEREELVGGLEADLAELVADGGSVAELGDARAYADELRSAAGLERRRGHAATLSGVRRPRRPLRVTTADVLDGARERWERRMASRPGLAAAWEAVQHLRPAWWLLRAWVAVQVLDMATGPWEYLTLVPRFGDDVTGLLVLAGAAVVSVLMGLRKVWPASHSPRWVSARVVLVGLNLFAVVMTLAVVNGFPSAGTLNHYAHPNVSGMFRPYQQPGLLNDGRTVRNIYAYGADGNPIEGVQLFDQRGKPLAVEAWSAMRLRYQGRTPMVYAWRNGDQEVWNAYPLPVRFGRGWERSDRAWTSASPPFLPQPPMLAVPPVTLPLAEEPAAEEELVEGEEAGRNDGRKGR